MVLQKSIQVRGVVSTGPGSCRMLTEVIITFQMLASLVKTSAMSSFEETTVRYHKWNRLEDNGGKFTTSSMQMVTPDGGIICELLEKRIHTNFSLLQATPGNSEGSLAFLHGSAECHLQCHCNWTARTYSLKGNSHHTHCIGANQGYWRWRSSREGALGKVKEWQSGADLVHVKGIRLLGGRCKWDPSGAFSGAACSQAEVVCFETFIFPNSNDSTMYRPRTVKRNATQPTGAQQPQTEQESLAWPGCDSNPALTRRRKRWIRTTECCSGHSCLGRWSGVRGWG